MLKKSICKKLDLILDDLRSSNVGFNIIEFCKDNFDYKKKKKGEKFIKANDQTIKLYKYERFISILINDGYARRLTVSNKNWLRITDKGRVFKGYVKDRRNKVLKITGKYILWIALVSGGLFAAIYYAIQIFNLCNCN